MNTPWQVLVVDDDFRVAGIHADIVRAAPGFAVLDSVRTVAEARTVLGATPPDLLLADVYLPDGDGVELIRETRIDAFMITAADEAETVRRALHAGALGYLVKPFPRQALLDRLDRYARFRHVLSGRRGLSQEKIDQALTILHTDGQPANVSRTATEELVIDALADGESSAAEVADRTGVSRATAQRRLAGLASRGVVTVRLRYGSSGRPEHLYSKASEERN